MRAFGSRDADKFDALVAGLDGDQGAFSDLLDVVGSLRAVDAPAARPEFVSSLRTQLMAAAERGAMADESEIETRLTPRQRAGSRERRIAAVIGGFAVVGATGSMAMASQSALPGDALYPVKRAIENAQTNLQADDAGKAETLIKHAQARLDEVTELAGGGGDAAQISSTLADFTTQANQAADLALDDYAASGESEPVTALRNFAAAGMAQLSALGDVLPESARPGLITATQTLRQVDQTAWQLCPTCSDSGVAELPPFATLSLSKVLEGKAPATTAPTKPRKPNTKPTQEEASAAPTTEAPLQLPSDDTPTLPAPSDTATRKPGGKLAETIDGVVTDDLGIDGKPGLGPVPADGSTKDPVTGLVNGVTGILGDLLK